MAAPDTEAAAWAEAGFDASLIGLRAATENVIMSMRGVARCQGDVTRCKATLAALVRDLDHRAGSIPAQAGDPITAFGEPIARGLPHAPSSQAGRAFS